MRPEIGAGRAIDAGEGDGTAPATSPRPAPSRGGGRLLSLAVVGLVLAAAVWAYRANTGGGGAAMDMSARVSGAGAAFPVEVEAVARGPVAGAVTYTGSVAPFSEEDIYPRVTGRILEMSVYPGDAVGAGQVVARLDDVELASRVGEADAMLARARADRAQMEADLVGARHTITQMDREVTMVETELGYARGVAARAERLVRSGAIAQQDYESDRAAVATLEAKRDAARARLAQSRAMEAVAQRKIEAADAMVAQGEAQRRTAQIVREYVSIRAPSAGYVVKRLVPPGVLVQPGMAILKLARIDRVRLQANVGETDLPAIAVGAPVTVAAAAGRPAIAARVTAVFPFVDQGPRTAVVEAIVDNADRRLLPGQYVSMRFTTGARPDALHVPRGAVSRLGGRATVWVDAGGRAEPRVVTVGLEGPDRVEITSGLDAGERVIRQGQDGLYAGARVAAVAAPAVAPTAGAPSRETAPSAPAPAAPKGGSHVGH